MSPRRALGTEPAVKTSPQWQIARVSEIIEEAPDAVTLRLGLARSVEFLPGQYYNVRLSIPGHPRPVQRAYSIGSSPLPNPSIIDLGVREVPDGMISPRLVRELRVGEEIEVRGPSGRFTWTGDDGRAVLLVGAGSGLVPLVAMIRYAVAARLEVPICLVCSASTYAHALYRDELSRLAAQHGWLEVVHCITRDGAEPRASYHRRIDQDLLADVLDGHIPPQAFLCGPPEMVDVAAAALINLGSDPEGIRSEKYD
jgi:ferredoxin-NADP reductase